MLGQFMSEQLNYGFAIWNSTDEKSLLDGMAYIMLSISLIVFTLLCFMEAPYGRYSSSSWGSLINVRLAWCTQEVPALVIPLLYISSAESPQMSNKANQILMGLFCIHYFQRAFVYPYLIRGGKPSPLFTYLVALIFCVYNGYMQGCSLSTHLNYPDNWVTHPCFVTGILVFFCGLFINLHSDYILRNLRKPGEKGYTIPKGGMFEYVSGANFFGESLEWYGFALASLSLQSLAFAVFTSCNLGMRAYHHHKWYLKKFENYPAKRCAYIPYVL